MGKSTPGFILGLIGGILGVISGIITVSLAGVTIALTAIYPLAGLFGGAVIGIGIWSIISGALVVWFSTWMRDPRKCRVGGIWTLVLSIVGSGGILGIIGGIFGIVQGGKK